MIINRSNLKTLMTGFKATFQGAFDGAPSDFQTVATVVPSSTAEEEYGWLGTTTRFREWLGDRAVQNLKQFSYTIRNKSFENTVGVDRDDIDDDRFGVYGPMFQNLGFDAKQHPDELVFALLNAGFATVCYDGQFFFDTDHPVMNADGVSFSTVSNSGGGAGTPWYIADLTRPIKPIIFQKRRDYAFQAMDDADDEKVFSQKLFRYGIDARVNVGYGLWQLAYGSKQTLDATQLKAAIAALRGMKGDNGRPLGVRPSHLIVPPALEFDAKVLVEGQFNAAGGSNVLAGSLKVISTPWLA